MAAATKLIEQTSKRWKTWQMIGTFLVMAGIVALMAGAVGVGASVATTGVLMYAGGRMGAWWHHG